MIDDMNEEWTVLPADKADVSIADDYYVRHINWLVEIGRVDLIDEIADECERRRSPRQPLDSGTAAARHPAIGSRSGAGRSTSHGRPRRPVPTRERADPDAANRLARGQDSSGTAARVPTPVQTGTRLAVAQLRRFASATGRLR
jgi:hypothetical protein